MKQFIVIVIAFLSTNAGNCQLNDFNAFLTYEHDSAVIKKNHVKSLSIQQIYKDQNLRHQIIFDTAGRVTNRIFLSQGEKLSEYVTFYDQYNQRFALKTINFENNTATDTSLLMYDFEYKKGKVVRQQRRGSDFFSLFNYNAQGLLDRIYVAYEGDTAVSETHKYDNHGKEIEVTYVSGANKNFNCTTYNKQGKVYELKQYESTPPDTTKILAVHRKFFYNSAGKLIKDEFLGGNSDWDNKTTEYEYDNKGNIIAVKKAGLTVRCSYNEKNLLIKKEGPLSDPKYVSVENYEYSYY